MKSRAFLNLFLTSIIFAAAFLSSSGSGPGQKSERSGALQALEFWTASRAYPQGDIPPDGYFRAYQHKTHGMRKAVSFSGTDSLWRYIGPNNFGGRMISVEVNPMNPNTIYAGSASGGLWRSYTGGVGADWQRVVTGFPVLGVNAVVIDPVDTNTILIGTGELYRYQVSNGGTMIRTTRGSVGMGILKSTDAGNSWEMSLDWTYNQRRGVAALRFNPQNSATIFAATSEGVYRSVDHGKSWDSVLPVLMARDIAIHPNDTTLVLATCGNFASPGHGLYRSTDGGSSFVQVGGLPSFSGMAVLGVFRSAPDTVYMSISDSTTTVGRFYESNDFGGTWVLKNTDNRSDVQGWYARFVAVHPEDPNEIVRGAQSLYKSTDGGSSFNVVANRGWADYHAHAYHPTNPEILYMADDGGIWRTMDFGDNWAWVGEGIETAQFYNGFSSSASDSLIALGQTQDHFGWRYTGDLLWSGSAVDEVGWTAINQQNDQFMYAGTRGGGSIHKSSNRGVSFVWSSNGINGGATSWNTPFVLSASNPAVLYFGRSIVFKSTNAAGSWFATHGGSELDGNPGLSMAMSHTGTDTVYIGTAPLVDRPHIFRTTDGGFGWTNVTGILPDRYPLDLAVDPTNSAVVYVAFGGFDTSHVFKSTDAGLSWMDITGNLPDVPATALLVDPLVPQIVYAGTDIGVFVSTDGGGDWLSWDDGFPEAAIVSDLSISSQSRIIRASTHSNGVYERKMFDIPTGVEETGDDLPNLFRLEQNYPNPFNPVTTIRYSLAEEAHVLLKVYDLLGREVATLVDGRQNPGKKEASWDASDRASGTYFYTLKVGTRSETKKMNLVR